MCVCINLYVPIMYEYKSVRETNKEIVYLSMYVL